MEDPRRAQSLDARERHREMRAIGAEAREHFAMQREAACLRESVTVHAAEDRRRVACTALRVEHRGAAFISCSSGRIAR